MFIVVFFYLVWDSKCFIEDIEYFVYLYNYIKFFVLDYVLKIEFCMWYS